MNEQLKRELAPDLELLRPLGTGAIADVYLAREGGLKRMVAVKVMRADIAQDDVARQRFEREAQAFASIKHPNVTAIYRIGRLADGRPFMVMEYIEGRTLADLLEARGPLSADDARRVLASVATALAAAHRRSIVHRDVRPGNIMREEETDRIVLMDFGLAALLDTASQGVSPLTMAGQKIGDPLHMSPEQLRGEPVTQQSDVYGLGVLAYELITGSSPWRSPTQLAQPPRPLHETRPDVAPELSDLIRRCLAQTPDHRPRAVEVFESLMREPAPAGTPLQPSPMPLPIAEPESALQSFLRELGRRKVYRVAAGYIAAAFLLLQGVQLILPALQNVDGAAVYRVIVALTLAGFPIALILSWVFDITAAGIKRSRTTGPSPQRSSTRLVLPIAGLALSAAIAFGVWLLLTR